MKVVAFFNNKGGVGKTTLVYHLAWMYQLLGIQVVALDLDPQANLTAAFLDEEVLESLWQNGNDEGSIAWLISRLNARLGDIEKPEPTIITDRLALVRGDLGLSAFEDRVADAWTRCLSDVAYEGADGFRVTTAFYRVAEQAALRQMADLVLLDVGPSLGALNRAALVACDFVVVPLGADLYSLQGLRNLGPTLRSWRSGWRKRLKENLPGDISLPQGEMKPVGYIMMQHAVRRDRPVQAYLRWAQRIPAVYREHILGELSSAAPGNAQQLASLKHYRSLMPMAQDARKPMFLLRPADGAIGGHSEAVLDCFRDFEALARRIAMEIGLTVPARPY